MEREVPRLCPVCAEVTPHVERARRLGPAAGWLLVGAGAGLGAAAWAATGSAVALLAGLPCAWLGRVVLQREHDLRRDLACTRCRDRELRALVGQGYRPRGSHRILDLW